MADGLISKELLRMCLDEFMKLTEKTRNEPGAGLMVYAMDGAETAIRTLRDKLDVLPTADAVEVVRCKDCELRGTSGCPMKTSGSGAYIGMGMYDEGSDKTSNYGFCHRGKKMDGGGEG